MEWQSKTCHIIYILAWHTSVSADRWLIRNYCSIKRVRPLNNLFQNFKFFLMTFGSSICTEIYFIVSHWFIRAIRVIQIVLKTHLIDPRTYICLFTAKATPYTSPCEKICRHFWLSVWVKNANSSKQAGGHSKFDYISIWWAKKHDGIRKTQQHIIYCRSFTPSWTQNMTNYKL